jgi:amino acid adenylation domain-containing protein/non-ribosomal peptide synthase protein (TIGR01720 family)
MTSSSVGTDARRKELLARRLAAAGLSRTGPGDGSGGAEGVRPRQGRTKFPLSFAQRRMWLHQQIVPGSTAYNLCIELSLEGGVSDRALATAFHAVVRRHEIFRTTYHDHEGVPFQRVHERLAWEPRHVDLRREPEDQRRARVGELAREYAGRPYDLARDSSLRVVFVRESATRLTVLLGVHHIAWDGLTFAALSRDLERYYREALAEDTVEPELPGAQFADHAVAEQRAWEDDPRSVDLAFWQGRLVGPAPALFAGLPAEDPEAPPESGRRQDRRMSPAAADAVRGLARALDTTPYVIVLSGYITLLSRFAGTDDVAVGAAVLNREEAWSTDLAGNFNNIIVLRNEVRANDSFQGLVRRVARTTAEAFEHQRYPYDKLVESLNPARAATGGALFEATLDFLAQRIEGPSLPGVRTSYRRTDNLTAQHPLALEVFLTADRMDVEATYASARLSGRIVARLLAELESLLQAAALAPERAVAELMAPATDRPVAAPRVGATRMVPELWRERAHAAGRAPALVAGDRIVSYAELADRVSRLSQRLRAEGVGPEVRVAVLLPRSVDLVVAVLAVLEAGGVLVPVDSSYPGERIRYLLDDAHPACLVGWPAGLSTSRGGIVTISPDQDQDQDQDTGPEQARGSVRAAPGNAAYLVYTSGSTGRPKGVLGTHRGLAHRLAWANEAWPVEPGATRLAKSSIGFIDGLTELLAALLGGARVVLADDRAAIDPVALARLVAEHEVDQLTAVPSLVDTLAEVPGAEWGVLRRWVCSGEPLTMAVARRAAALAPGSEVVNSYGSSEVAGDVLTDEVAAGVDNEVTVGRPVPGAEIALLDRFLNPVPEGVVGEVYVGGPQLARGYAGRAGETAARFVANPRGTGQRLYRTGDLGRRRPDGRVVLLGRADQQVKIRGVRVEPGEVEAVLTGHPRVGRAAVVFREDLPGGPGLVGYLVPSASDGLGGEPIDLAEVRRWMRERLPAQLVPALLTTLDELPRTSSGKLDRRALPAPAVVSTRPTGSGRVSAEVKTLCALFGEILERDGIGPDDDFFALGGHSLSALRLVNRIRSVLGVSAGVAHLFAVPTAHGLATLLASESEPEELPPLVPRDPAGPPVLSAGQLQMWALARVEGPSPRYNVPRMWRVEGPLDVPALRAAVADVVARHEVLRTTYHEKDDGTPAPRVHPPDELAVPVSHIEVTAEECDELVVGAVRRPFDLGGEPPIRADVFTLSPTEHVVTLVVHHIAVDEWSYRTLLADLTAAYSARTSGVAPELAPPPVRYADFAAWRAEVLGRPGDARSRGERQLRYWASTLAGAPPETTLPLDRPRPEAPTARGAEVRFTVDADLAARLRAAAERHQVSMFMLLHAALAVLLGKHGAGEDVVIGSPVSGRRDAAAEGLVGFFLNTVALRVDLGGDPTVVELLKRVKRADLAAMAHADVPFQLVVERLNPGRSARNPLFQVELVYLRADLARGGLELAGATVEPRWVSTGTAKFDATFQFFEATTGELHGVLEYAVELFDEATVRAVVERLRRLLTQLADAPEARLSAIPALSSGDQLRLLDRRTALAERADRPDTLSGLFARYAATDPDRVSLVAGADRLTYRELAARAGRIAAVLATRGVRPGDRVAVGIPRSAEMVVALLAVSWAGATYVPVDIGSPPRRLRLILDDAAPSCLLTTRAAGAGFDGITVPVLTLDSPDTLAELAEAIPGQVPVQVPSSQPAYVIYTSGSTGRPKGVEVSHRAVLDMLDAVRARFDLSAADGWTVFHSVAFDFSVFEVWGALGHGARVVVVDEVTTRSPDLFWALLRAERVSILSQTPSAFYQLAEAEPDDPGASASLRYIVLGGEALDPRRLRRWYERHAEDAPRLVNMYGITETTVHTTFRELRRDDADAPASPVGGPLPGLGVLLLDRRLNLVPAGVVGELYVSGGQVAQGYAGQPALTASRFVANPFGTGGERLYRSGDLARWGAGGELEFVGRADDQVKLRGFRIELGEVEAALLAAPAVGQAVVLLRADDPDHRRLVGYVVPATGAASSATRTGGKATRGRALIEPRRRVRRELDPAEVRAAVAALLPEHMVPAAIVVLDRIPLTVNGKLDKAALPTPEFGGLGEVRAPRTGAERTVRDAFVEVLNLPPESEIGIDEDFFALGGDSILAIRLVNRVRQHGLVIKPADVFLTKSVAGLAASARAHQTVDQPAGEVDAEGAGGAAPVTPLPIVHRLAEHSGSTRRSNQSSLIEVPAGRTPEGLVAALQAVIDRHDALRLRTRGGSPGYWGLECPPPGTVRAEDILRVVPLSDPAEPVGWVEAALSVLTERADAATDRLDPEAGVMLSAVLFRMPGGSPGLLLLVAHHLAVDGVSWHILLDDLENAWQAADAGAAPALAPVGTTLAEYGRLVSDLALGKRYLAEYRHWAEVLSGTGAIVDGPVHGQVTADLRHLSVRAPATLTGRALAALPTAGGVGMTELLLAALTSAVCSWRGGRRELLVDLERHGREEIAPGVDLSRTLGWFTVVFPVGLMAEDDPAALLADVRDRLGGPAESGIGFGMLRYLHPQVGPRLAGLGRPQVLFNYLGRQDGSIGLPPSDPRRVAARTDPAPDQEFRYALEVNAMVARGPDGPELQARFSAPGGLLSADDLDRISTGWLSAVAALVAAASGPEQGGTPS